MDGLHVVLSVNGRRCVVVGGGGTAWRRARTLTDAGADVTVVAPEFDPRIAALPAELLHRGYEPGDVAGAWLVVVATDDEAVNGEAATDAAEAGALVNRADLPGAGDVRFAATGDAGPVTLAVHTSGGSASAAAAIRDELLASLDPLWPHLVRLAAEARAKVQASVADPAARQAVLRRLVDDRARALLKEHGPETVRRHYDGLIDAAAGADGHPGPASP